MGRLALRVEGPGEALPAYLRSAVDFIMANLTEPLSVDDIAAAAGVSHRQLYVAFQVNFGLSVMAFVRQRRLELANRQLRAGDVEVATVTGVALNTGFQHLSRFASAYRQRFGEFPSETLRRRRGDGRPSFGGLRTRTQGEHQAPAASYRRSQG